MIFPFPLPSAPAYGASAETRSLSRRRAVALLAVAGLHLAVLLLLWQMKGVAAPRILLEPLWTELRLLPDRTERAATKPADPQRVQPRLRTERIDKPIEPELPHSILLPLPSVPESPAPAAAAQGSGKVGLDGTAIASPSLAASGPTGLNLTPSRDVLRGALANPATSDPRSNSVKPTFEERIAMGLDPELCVLQERMPDGTIRRRMSRYKRVQSTMSATHGQGTGSARICE